jgi:hypothetical protein
MLISTLTALTIAVGPALADTKPQQQPTQCQQGFIVETALTALAAVLIYQGWQWFATVMDKAYLEHKADEAKKKAEETRKEDALARCGYAPVAEITHE